VVFIHGLASDEGTWFDMVNELRTWPEFHRRFEPWVFHYPTGAAFVQSSARLRSELARAVRLLDPDGRDAALRRIVLVGHSMGGLHAKMQVVAPGTALWDSVAKVPFAEIRLPSAMRAAVQPAYFFEPVPQVTRVVCIATPHRGSVLASLGVGRLASVTVRPPPEAQALHDTAVRLNPGAFDDDFARKLPTTIDLLEPDSLLLRALERLRPACWVAVHSIVGDGHHSLTGGRDDCVVSVESAHTAGAASEIAVPATHTKVHHHPLTAAELRRILRLHLEESDR
jgi:pimeloyl-ACP methyl ester carboxylesterase